MKKLIIFALVLSSCASQTKIREDIKVAWQVTYTNNVVERVMAHQHSQLTDSGCFQDRKTIVRCDVRSARRIPLHVVELDGLVFQSD